MLNEKLISMIAACAITLGGLAVAAPALARQAKPVVVTAPPADDVPVRRVSYRDLDLLTMAGQSTLNRRVGSAVRGVCLESLGAASHFYLETDCRRTAWNGARPQIARAIERASDIAQNGFSSIPPVAITIGFGGE